MSYSDLQQYPTTVNQPEKNLTILIFMIRNHSTFQKLSLLFTLVIGAPLANAQQTIVTGTVTEPGGEPLKS